MAYTYTLQGHEYVACEDYEKALTAYRAALGADRRHYNTYYGIAKVYEKLGSLDKAYAQYLAASSINPTNAVLTCNIGTVLEKQEHLGQALRYYTKATELAPKAAYMRFKKARVLLVMGEKDAARDELMIVKDLTPNEATVHFLLGNLYKAASDKHQAMRHFTYALALDPKVLNAWRRVGGLQMLTTNFERRHHHRSRKPSKAWTRDCQRSMAMAATTLMIATWTRGCSRMSTARDELGVGERSWSWSWNLEPGVIMIGHQ